MGRIVAYVVGLALLVAGVCFPALFWNTGEIDESVSEETTITDYVAEFDLAADGDLDVVERLTVDFPFSGKRGIFRLFDRVDPAAPNARREVEDIDVTMDGRPVEVTLLSEQDGRITNARIGSENVFVDPGEHVYEISYHLDGVIEPGAGEQADLASQFYWNLIPSGWRQMILQSRLTVNLPVPAESVQCVVGVGDGAPCTLDGEGTDTLVVTTGALEPNSPVTLKTGLDLPTPPPGKELPWPARWDRVLGTAMWAPFLVLALALGAAVLGAMAARRTFERTPQFPLMYAPPEGIGPAQAKYLLTEDIDRETYVATLMHAAEQGAVDLAKEGDAWVITDKGGARGWAGLDPVTTGVAHLLGGPGTSFRAAPKDVAAGKRLKTEIASFEESTKTWATEQGHLTTAGIGGLGGLLVLAGLVGAIACIIWSPFSMSSLALVPGTFAVFGSPLLRTGAATKRTRSGRELWSRIGGFRRILATPSAQERFDFSGREELYTAYVPWAVALGCAEEWAAKYRTEMATEPPTPDYLASSYAGGYAGGVTSMVDDFDSTVSSAISSYQATQSSSSGGGGGFSGGGGGGGGGGGSW